MFAEAVLLVRLVEEIAEDRIVTFALLPGWARILLVMLLFVGAFGSLFLLMHRAVATRIEHAHDAVQQLPVPTPRFAVHGLILLAIFIAYAWWYGPETHALPEIYAYFQRFWQQS